MNLTDAQLWAAALGYLLPPVIAIVNQPRWSGPLKALLALLVAAADGLGSAYFTSEFTGKSIVTCILTGAIAIGVAYHTLWKPSGIVDTIEHATSTHGQPAPAAPAGN